MIKIINGTYGYREGTRVIPKTADSPAFKLTPEKEARLVNAGVAKYVTEKEAATAAATTPTGGQPEYNTGMKLDELKTIAVESYGVDAADAKKATTKAKVIELIEQAKAKAAAKPEPEDDPEDEDGDGSDDESGEGEDGDATPPSLTPTNPEE